MAVGISDACRYVRTCEPPYWHQWWWCQAEYIRFHFASGHLAQKNSGGQPSVMRHAQVTFDLWCHMPIGYHAARVANVQGIRLWWLVTRLLCAVIAVKMRRPNCPYESSWEDRQKDGLGIRWATVVAERGEENCQSPWILGGWAGAALECVGTQTAVASKPLRYFTMVDV